MDEFYFKSEEIEIVDDGPEGSIGELAGEPLPGTDVHAQPFSMVQTKQKLSRGMEEIPDEQDNRAEQDIDEGEQDDNESEDSNISLSEEKSHGKSSQERVTVLFPGNVFKKCRKDQVPKLVRKNQKKILEQANALEATKEAAILTKANDKEEKRRRKCRLKNSDINMTWPENTYSGLPFLEFSETAVNEDKISTTLVINMPPSTSSVSTSHSSTNVTLITSTNSSNSSYKSTLVNRIKNIAPQPGFLDASKATYSDQEKAHFIKYLDHDHTYAIHDLTLMKKKLDFLSIKCEKLNKSVRKLMNC